MDEPYILGMDDGSESLKHYGVLGMRWGVRNDETRERYARGHLSEDYKNPRGMAQGKLPGGKGRAAVESVTRRAKSAVKARSEMSRKATSGRNVKVSAEKAKEVKAKKNVMNGLGGKDALSITKADREAYENSLKKPTDWSTAKKVALGVGIAAGVAAVGVGLYMNRGLINHWTGGKMGESMAIATKCRQDVQNRIMRDTQLKKVPLDPAKLPDKDTFIPSSQEFHRMARHQFVDGQDSAYNSLFCSYLEHDVKGYRALYPHFAGQDKDVAMSPFQDLTIKFSEDIKIPSARKRVEVFQEMMRDPAHYESMCKDAVLDKGENWIKRNGGLDACVKRVVDRGVEKNLADGQIYRQWAGYSQGARTSTMEEYYKRMMKKGYNAITDDNDCGVCSDHPVIIMKNGITKVIGSETIDPKGASYIDAVAHSTTSGQFARRFGDTPLRHSLFEQEGPILIGMEDV